MVKRKKADGNDSEGDKTIPIPIQTFLWRQTSPFVRPKLGKLCEASCMSFERVVVQNILHGLSPSLCEAIQSVSRWRLIQTSLPHVIQCCAMMLTSRKQNSPGSKFTTNEIKLLYTLHWILLDAASECEDLESDQAVGRSVHSYLHSLDAIQLFVFLLIPLVSSIDESDFQSLKLENGLRLWEPLINYRQPDIPCFSTPVKAKRILLKAQRNLLKVNFNMANIYIGKGSSANDIYLGFDGLEDEKGGDQNDESPSSGARSLLAPLARMSDICALSTSGTNMSVDIICEVCNQTIQNRNGSASCQCRERRVSSVSMTSDARSLFASAVDKNFMTQRMESAISSFTRSYANPDILSASYFDVAVVQCFFCPQWEEEGVHWALKYVHHRLLEISTEMQNMAYQRERSQSLPTPDIKVSSSDYPGTTPVSPSRKDSASVEANALASVTLPMTRKEGTTDGRREPSFKRMRVFIEDKMKQLRHRDSVDQFDIDSKGLIISESTSSFENFVMTMESNGDSRRPDSALSRLTENDEDSLEEEDKDSCDSSSDNNNRQKNTSCSQQRRKSLFITEEDDDSSGSGEGKEGREGRGKSIHSIKEGSRLHNLKPESHQKPIIMITSESPEPSFSPKSLRWLTKHRDSLTSVKSRHAPAEETGGNTFQRSVTDSNINYYNGDEVEEAPGSTFYIQYNGQLNYHVVLQGVHNIANRVCSTRICGVILHIVNCFLDLNIIEKVGGGVNGPSDGGIPLTEKCQKQTKNGKMENEGMPSFGKKKEYNTFEMAIETVFRVYKTLGCPYGCGEGVRGLEGDHLRTQGINCLTRLMRANPPLFKKFLQTKFLLQPLQTLMDNLHAVLGFCAEPLLSPLGLGPRKSVAEPGHRTGYGNNFGELPAGGSSVQGQLVVNILKPLLTKFVENRKEIMAHENIGLFCDIRQLMAYVKEVHGGTFRCVALSGLMDALKPAQSREPVPSTKFIRRTLSVTSESGDEREGRLSCSTEGNNNKTRHNLFRKRIKKRIYSGATSDSEGFDDTSSFHGRLSPRVSISIATDDDIPILSKRKSSKFNLENLGRSGHDLHTPPNNKETISIREKKLVNSYAVKSGLLRFNFMLDCCNPGALPDAHLIAALLDLEAPIVARATLLLECSYFVNRCNRGDWPNWMKLNLPGMLHVRSQPSGYRKNLILQKSAGRLFHQWAEALGNHMADILMDESPDIYSFIDQVKEEGKKKELRVTDDEEDFLDEATVSQSGTDCPFALKMVACHLLFEITTFLRETYQYLPKLKPFRHETISEKPETSRRWSSIVGSPVISDRSNSKSSQGEGASHSAGIASDRKISFAVLGMSERSDSIHSSTTSISQLDAANDGKGKRVGSGSVSVSGGAGGGVGGSAGAGQKLLKARRGSGHTITFKQNCSFKIKRPEGGGSVKRMGSTKTRKVSTQSLHSATSVEDAPSSYAIFEEVSDAASINANDDANDTLDASEGVDEQDYSRFMPWIKVVVQLANRSNFICDHLNYCHPNCYERQRRSCSRLLTALDKIYASDRPELQTIESDDTKKESDSKESSVKDKLKRRESVFHGSSPTSRRESTPLLEKVKVDINLLNKAKAAIALEREEEKKRKAKKSTDKLPAHKYLSTQVLNLTHCPLAVISKAAPILSDETFIDIMPVAWELLIESDQELAAAAAVVFILASVRVPEQTKDLMNRVLHHQNVSHRISAILRFGVLWRFRHQVWPRMEDGSHVLFKIPPPSIDFVLPSPTIGLCNLPITDPPWMPHFKTKVEEVTINQKESKSLVTATTTRRKQQQQMIHRALLAEEDRRRAARENFLMTSVAITHQAAFEPILLHSVEDHEDGDDEKSEHFHSHHVQLAQQFFPSSICSAVLPIVYLLEDLEVNDDGVAVCEVAEKVVWNCLVEDPALFLRFFLEKLTVHQKQEELIFLLRKLLYHLKNLPAPAAHCLLNYLIGFIMFYVRSPTEGGQGSIAQALSIIWQVVPSVCGIYFKDLKQTLRKEQCDPTIMISANVPSTKKLIVHGPDLSSIPSQFPVQEDTQFLHILHESLDFFNIPSEEHAYYFIVDAKTNQMHNVNSYVRDFYFFRRNFYPQLSLVRKNLDEASAALDHQSFILKFLEIGKVLFSLSVVDSSLGQQVQSHVSFLHEELLKLPSFPRKALESEFGVYHGSLGKETCGVDLLHKYVWTKLIARMFRGMSSTVTHVGDLPLFLNVINGTLHLHADDTATLRLCLATFINACRHFKQVFATTGFTFIMPTLLKVYSNHQSNPIVCKAIEFSCLQFFLLHRNPFILQMFGSISTYISLADDVQDFDFRKIPSDEFFHLLLSFEKNLPDNLDILEMIEGEKPLCPLDFCYTDNTAAFTIIDAINLCITVIAYACDSVRAMQMLVILEAILPNYLQHLKEETVKQDSIIVARDEISSITSLSISIKSLVASCENLTRNFSGVQQWNFESAGNMATVNASRPTQNHANHSPKGNRNYYDEHSDIKYRQMEEGIGNWRRASVENENEAALQEFRKPRNSVLCLVSEFFSHCSARTIILRKLFLDSTIRCPELLDHKTHNRLADIAHTLLKIAPYDPGTMKCRGLRRYMMEILPITDWSQTTIRPALNLILRRLERLFNKIYKKPCLRCNLDWNSATNLVKAINSTLVNCTYVAHLPHIKTLISTCLNIILADDMNTSSCNSGSVHSMPHKFDSFAIKSFAPSKFCSAVIKLTIQQMQALGDQYTLEQVCGGSSVFSTVEKTINLLVNLVLPLCIRMGSGRLRKDYPRMRQSDINFALTVILNALLLLEKSSAATRLHQTSASEVGRTGSIMSHESRKSTGTRDGLQNIVFLGLKILMVSFEKQLSTEWYRISKCISNLGSSQIGVTPLWKFLDFVMTVRMPLYVMLLPFIQYTMMKVGCETQQEYYLQQIVHQKLLGLNMPDPKCKGSILIELAAELKQAKEDLSLTAEAKTNLSSPVHSDYSSHQLTSAIPRTSSIHDLLEYQMTNKILLSAPVTSLPPPPASAAAAAGAVIAKKMYTAASLDVNLSPQNFGSFDGSKTTAPLHPIKIVSRTQSPAEESPALTRKASKRITAQDGNLILEKYTQKLGSQGEDVKGSPSTVFLQRLTSDETDISDYDPPMHRLQRQDAKSRKTFKIKRNRSTIKGSITRSATVKGGTRYHMALIEGSIEAGANESGDAADIEPDEFLKESIPATRDGGMMAMKTKLRQSTAVDLEMQSRSSDATAAAATEEQHSLEDEDYENSNSENMQDLKSKARNSRAATRFMQKSKSHDDASDSYAPAGTARGRIARHGARLMYSRSPSSSPPQSPTDKSIPCKGNSETTFTKSESMESLNTGEDSSLLTKEEKNNLSNTTILVYFGDSEIQDSRV